MRSSASSRIDGGGGDGFADTVDEIVTSLDQDPVLVQELMGNGHTDAVVAALKARSEDVGLPVYVVMTRTPTGLNSRNVDEELASVLHGRIGGDGIYLVHTHRGSGHVGVWGDLDPTQNVDGILLSLATSRATDQLHAAVSDQRGADFTPGHVASTALALDLAAEPALPDYATLQLTDQELAPYTTGIWVAHAPEYRAEPQPPTVGLSSLVAVAVGVTVAVVGYRLLQAWSARVGSREAGSLPGSAETRMLARTELAELDRRLSTVGVSPGRAGLDRIEMARECRDAAERLLPSADPLDQVGALVLARTGSLALDRLGAAATYRCCYLNPLHGAGSRTTSIGGSPVPVCRTCEQGLAGQLALDPLLERRRFGRARPYYTGSSIWATTGFGSISELWQQLPTRRTR